MANNLLAKYAGSLILILLLGTLFACSSPARSVDEAVYQHIPNYVGTWELTSIDYGDRILTEPDLSLSGIFMILTFSDEDTGARGAFEEHATLILPASLQMPSGDFAMVWVPFGGGGAMLYSAEEGDDSSYTIEIEGENLILEYWEGARITTRFVFEKQAEGLRQGVRQ